MVINNIQKDYGSQVKTILYWRDFEASPPDCSTHLKINCQICFKRGKYNDLSKLDADQLKKLHESKKTSARRAKTTITDLVLCNKFDMFFTLTFDQKLTDSFDYDHCKKLVSKWINNQRRTSPSLSYILVSEKHKSGAIHFHMVVSNFNGGLSEAVNKKTKRKIKKNGKQIYNLEGWKYGFSTASLIQDKTATAYYIQKYLAKDFIEAFNKKRFWTSRGLKRPVKAYNIDVDKFFHDYPPLFRTLFATEAYFMYTGYKGAAPTLTTKQLENTKAKRERAKLASH